MRAPGARGDEWASKGVGARPAFPPPRPRGPRAPRVAGSRSADPSPRARRLIWAPAGPRGVAARGEGRGAVAWAGGPGARAACLAACCRSCCCSAWATAPPEHRSLTVSAGPGDTGSPGAAAPEFLGSRRRSPRPCPRVTKGRGFQVTRGDRAGVGAGRAPPAGSCAGRGRRGRAIGGSTATLPALRWLWHCTFLIWSDFSLYL
jgi:hypothetical protein